jgi:signal transduction histidine kinase
MSVDTNAEIRALRTVLRDLVALSAIPAALAGREPAAVAAGLADVLIELLQLEFVFVRLRVPSAADAVDVMRGTAWKTFPAWLESHLAESGRLSGIEIIPDVDGGPGPCGGVAIPIGVNAEGGVVIAACGRLGFPTEIDQILLGLAANNAATAFQNATLIHERTRAEEELRRARDVLETKVAERTAELAASRARIVTAADETRRRIERDLHDGVQQRLVSLVLAQRGVEAMVPPELGDLLAQMSRLADGLTGALEELQEISRGIHPAILARGGLVLALKALARRSAVPVELEVQVETRLPEPVERAAYYIVSEALTNTAKHARASTVHVAVEVRDGVLRLSVRDDGRGGADPARGSGLIGLTDRVDALAGTIQVTSPVGAGTTLLVTLPIEKG